MFSVAAKFSLPDDVDRSSFVRGLFAPPQAAGFTEGGYEKMSLLWRDGDPIVLFMVETWPRELDKYLGFCLSGINTDVLRMLVCCRLANRRVRDPPGLFGDSGELGSIRKLTADGLWIAVVFTA